MELKQLSDFVAVCRAGSFAAAARRINTSQPGLGYQIKQLENELDAELLQRHSRGITPTAAGSALLDHAERILDAVKDARTAMAPYRQNRRTTLRIGLSPTPARLVGRAMGTLAARMPKVEFMLREGFSEDLVDLAIRGELDVAITLSGEPRPGFRVRPLYREKLCLIGKPAPDLAGNAPVTLQQLAAMPIVAGPRGHIVRERLMAAARIAGVALNVVQELDPSGLRRSLVVYGEQRTVAALGVFVDEVERDLLAARPLDPPVELVVHMVCAATVSLDLEAALASAIGEVLAPFAGLIDTIAVPA